MVMDLDTTSLEARSLADGAYRSMNLSPSLFLRMPPSPRDPSHVKMDNNIEVNDLRQQKQINTNWNYLDQTSIPSVMRHPAPYIPVGWNWTNSRSCKNWLNPHHQYLSKNSCIWISVRKQVLSFNTPYSQPMVVISNLDTVTECLLTVRIFDSIFHIFCY